jgi:hypothetical protein
MMGELSDIPPERLDGVSDAMGRVSDFYFYELAFEAKSKMVATDYVGALLMAVAALEGVHGAFVTNAMQAILPRNRTGENKNLEDNFLKELGFSLCNKLTPYLLMKDGDRPSPELIQGVSTAIKFRNEIMHALRTSSGEYRIRTRTNVEISEAYSSVLKMYELYRKALDRVLLMEQRHNGQ